MGRFTHVLLTASAAVLFSAWLPSSALAAAGSCDFRLGFKAIHDRLPERVGSCLDGEAYNSIGDSVQHAAGGLLAWRHSDNWTAFTDGYHTWVNGPNGLQERLNSERFPWEHDMTTSTSSSDGSSSNVSSSSSITSTTNCTAVARSGSVSATGLNSSTTITSDGGTTTVTNSGNGSTTISTSSSDGSGTSTTVISNSSTSTSSPGVATSGC